MDIKILDKQDVKKRKCALCGKDRDYHKATTLHCPEGSKSRIGYTYYHRVNTFIEKKNA